MDPEIFAHDYSLDLLVTVKPQGHTFSMRVSPRFVSHFSNSPYEQFSCRLTKNFIKRSDLFLDIGAHYGFYCLAANEANKNIKIIAVEPIDENFEILKMNLEANGISPQQVRTVKMAAGNHIGKLDLYKSLASDNCGVFEHPNAAPIATLTVAATTIDEILSNEDAKSLFIKLDTEGNELDVLRGMEKTFEKYRDLSLLIEMNPKMLALAGTTCKDVLDYLSSKDFKAFGIDDQDSKYYPLDVEENLIRMQQTNSYFNILCIKQEVALSVGFFSHSPLLAGAERSLGDLVQDLCGQGILCSVILPYDGPLKNVLLNVGASVHILNGAADDYQWIAPHNAASFAAAKDTFTSSMASITVQAISYLKRLSPDVIYSQTMASPWGGLCAEILSIPHAWSVCEYGNNLEFYYGFSESINALYESSAVIFCITKSVRNEVFKGHTISEDKLPVVYRRINIESDTEDTTSEEKIDYAIPQTFKIGIFGTISEWKGQEDLVRAAITLLKNEHKVEIHLYGYADLTYGELLVSLIKKSGFEEAFIMSNFLNNPYAKMKEMDIIVSCSRSEGLGRTLIEAALLKKPIIYADSGGPKEIFVNHEHGLSYTPGNYLDLADKILITINDPARTAYRINKAGEHVRNVFTLENYSKKIERYLRKIKSENQGRLANSILALLTENKFSDIDGSRDYLLNCYHETSTALFALQDLKAREELNTSTALFAPQDLKAREELNAIHESNAWKMLFIYYKTRDRLFPAGSMRRKIVKAMYLLIFDFTNFKRNLKGATMLLKIKSFTQRKLSGHPFLYRMAKSFYVTFINKPYSIIEHNKPSNLMKPDMPIKIGLPRPTGNYQAWYEDNLDFSHHSTDIKAIAFHLPQFHQIPENDLWWGEGFTEWTNTKKAKPLFDGHYQPREPHDDIGYYDLSDVEVLKKQVRLARQHGIYGFCFHHYWFSGKRLLEKPLDILLEHPDIDINFCLCWANENWTRRWDGKDKEILIEQKYQKEDPLNFIKDIEKYLADKRYITIDGKPVILIYKVPEIPKVGETVGTWRNYCREKGIGEIAVFAVLHGLIDPDSIIKKALFDGFVEFPPHRCFTHHPLVHKETLVFDYAKSFENNDNHNLPIKYYRTLMFGWDNTPRLGDKSTIFNNFSIKTYYDYFKQYIGYTRRHFKKDQRFLFINAWNEWAEGTYLEPDKRYGYALLNMTSRALFGLTYNNMIYNQDYEKIKRQIDTQSNCSYALISTAVKAKSEILEFGPASGYFTRYLVEEKKAVVDIVELSWEYAEKACVYARDCVVGDIEDYRWLDKFGDRKYDHIIFADVLEHLRNPWCVLEKTVPLLKPHGSIIISLPNIAHNAVLATLYNNDFSYQDFGVLDKTHLRFFTEKTARKMIKNAGLRITDVKYVRSSNPSYLGMDCNMNDLPETMRPFLQKRKNSDVVQFIFICE